MSRRTLSRALVEILDHQNMRGLLAKSPPERAVVFMSCVVALRTMLDEWAVVKAKYPDRFHSAHEALAVLEEEVHELRTEVYKKEAVRDPDAMRYEAIQVATVALRIASEI